LILKGVRAVSMDQLGNRNDLELVDESDFAQTSLIAMNLSEQVVSF
tara:strand:+ start:1612 stop:1749 length:138 start_codon:yes stop_codon:yes gene_type:complete